MNLARDREQPRSVRIIWLVLPLAALLGVGVYFIARDRRLVEQEARERAAEIARAALAGLERAATNVVVADFSDASRAWPSNTAFIQVGAEGQLVFPRPILAPEPFEPLPLLGTEEAALWTLAEEAEFQAQDLQSAEAAWGKLTARPLPEGVAAVAKFNRAVVLAALQRHEAARAILTGLLHEPVVSRGQAGIAVAHLAGIKLLTIREEAGLAGDGNWVEKGIEVHLEHPSAVTPYFLREGSRARWGDDQSKFETASAVWADHELARRLHRDFVASRVGEGKIRAAGMDGRAWWSFWMDTNVLFRSSESVAMLASGIAGELRTPSYLRLAIATNEAPTGGALFAQASDGAMTVQAWLADPAALYAIQRQRAWLFGGVLAVSGLVAWLGIAQLDRNYQRQQRLNELKSNFVSSVSHELRAPLASMRLMSESLQSGRVRDAEKQREYFDFLVQECRRLSGLVENVLDFSRIEQNRRAYRFEETSLRAVCEGALRTVSPAARENGVALEFDGPPDPEVTGEADGPALQQAAVNLLDNAIKHSPRNGTVRLGLKTAKERAEISVRDEGRGIPASEHERIFERFYRLGSELRRETQGVGIGLSIVKHAVEAHGGAVRVESEPGKGATFTMELPLKQKAVA